MESLKEVFDELRKWFKIIDQEIDGVSVPSIAIDPIRFSKPLSSYIVSSVNKELAVQKIKRKLTADNILITYTNNTNTHKSTVNISLILTGFHPKTKDKITPIFNKAYQSILDIVKK